MLHVDISGFKPPDDWLEKAEGILKQLEDAPDAKTRKIIIRKNSRVWASLKSNLIDIGHGKCWFSEAKDCFNHWHVEHFRPKSEAKDLDGNKRDGYWWLAFDYKNYRICGGAGNSSKSIYFPLCSGSHEATDEDRNYHDERPLLLDPTSLPDTQLISFKDGGKAVASEGYLERDTLRAKESIKIYALNEFPALKTARANLWTDCSKRIVKANNAYEAYGKTGSLRKEQEFADSLDELKALISKESEFSTMVRACLKRCGYVWADRLASHPG